jgi:putative ABC transport system substrate-binding protein
VIGRRAFLGAAALGVLALPRLGEARLRAPFRVPRVGVLGEADPLPWIVRPAAVDIECRWADVEGRPLADLAAQLLAADVDLLVALGAAPARAVCERTTRLPIVAIADGDLGEDSVVADLARSVGNVTWLTAPSEAGLALQRAATLGRLVPTLRRLAVLFNPDNGTNLLAMARLSASALAAAVDLRRCPTRTIEEIERAFLALTRDRADGVLVLSDTLFSVHAAQVAALTDAAGVAAAYGARVFVEKGGLLAIYGDTSDTIRRTAAIAGRILAGQRPASLSAPTARPRTAVNVATAMRLGMRVPATLLADAETLGTV